MTQYKYLKLAFEDSYKNVVTDLIEEKQKAFT